MSADEGSGLNESGLEEEESEVETKETLKMKLQEEEEHGKMQQ